MATLRALREERLRNDYARMCSIKQEPIDWTVRSGEEPYVDSYNLVLSIKSPISNKPDWRGQHTFIVELPLDYPAVPPAARSADSSSPFNPNFYCDGRWCFGRWIPSEFLADFVIRMARTLQFDATVINTKSAANGDAARWYEAQRKSGMFPCDRQTLPAPNSDRLRVRRQLRMRT